MVNKKTLLFVALNVPCWVLYFTWGQGLRLATIFLAFGAMWSLWVARRERKHIWTSKLHDIWLVQILWCVATVEANSEYFYRHITPSVAILMIDFVLWLTIKGVFNGERYTVDQP
jgi:hypothetical protein